MMFGTCVQADPRDVDRILATGMKWTQQHGHSWPEDSNSCEEFGCYPNADPSQVFPTCIVLTLTLLTIYI